MSEASEWTYKVSTCDPDYGHDLLCRLLRPVCADGFNAPYTLGRTSGCPEGSA